MRTFVKFMMKDMYKNPDGAGCFLFFFCEPTNQPPSIETLITFCNVLRECRYRQEDGSELTLSTIIDYIRSLILVLKSNECQVSIFEDGSFTDKRRGLIPVLEIRFAQHQA